MTFRPCISQLITQVLYSVKVIYRNLMLSYKNIKIGHSVHSEKRDAKK